MLSLEASDIRVLIEAAVTAVSILGGVMALFSGYAAARAMSRRRAPSVLSQWINEGIGEGFTVGAPLAALIFALFLWI